MNNIISGFRFVYWLLAMSYLTLFNISCDKKSTKIDVSQQSIKRQVIKPKVTTTKVKPEDIAYTIEAVGSLAADIVSIPAKVNGVVTKLSFREGSYVVKGTTLAEIDPLLYELELQKAKTQVKVAKAQIKIAIAKKKQSIIIYKKARIDYQKRKELYRKNVVTAEELLSFQTIYNQAKANIKEIKASIEQAKANLEHTKVIYNIAIKNFKESKVSSPISGIIQSKNVTIGQYVRQDTVIATIVDIDNLYLKFNVTQSEATQLYVGKKINFTIPSKPTEMYSATIFYISQYANPTTRMVEIRTNHIQPSTNNQKPIDNDKSFNLPNSQSPNNLLRPGYFTNVSIETDIHKNAVVVPLQAVLTTEEGNIVFILEGNIAREKKVELGLHTKDSRVEVLLGINSNDTIVVLGANVLQDGMEVEQTNQ